MCLRVLMEPPKKTPKYAWKVFEKRENKLKFPHYNIHNIYVGRWMTAVQKNIYLDNSTTYKSGFHCFLTKKDALRILRIFAAGDEVARKVEIKNVIAFGEQWRSRVIVVEKIKVMPKGGKS